jgi:hypothetical protein
MRVKSANGLNTILASDNEIVIDDRRRSGANAGNEAVLAESGCGPSGFGVEGEHFVVRDSEDNARRRLVVSRPVRKAATVSSFYFEFPDLPARNGIKREDILAGIEIHHTVDYERGAFGIYVVGWIACVECPGATKLGDILLVNLSERGIPHRARVVAGVAPIILAICGKIILGRESAGQEQNGEKNQANGGARLSVARRNF